MPDELTGFVTDSIVHLVSAFLMLRSFLPPTVKKRGGPLLVCSCLYLLMGIVVETILNEWIREGTLVFLFFFFILLANRLCKLPLLHAWCAMFCHFSLMLGYGTLGFAPGEIQTEQALTVDQPEENLDRFLEVGILRETPPTPTPVAEKTGDHSEQESDVLRSLRSRMLHRKLDRSRELLLEILYPGDPGGQTPHLMATPVPTSAPARPTPVPGSRMEKEEFFLLFSPTPTPSPEQIPTPQPLLPTPTPNQGATVVDPVDAVAVNSDQLNNMVKLRNRSTDANYLPPRFEIDALGIGANGRYAIVNGVLMREGNIIRIETGTVRGWRLVKIKENDLFWQPLL